MALDSILLQPLLYLNNKWLLIYSGDILTIIAKPTFGFTSRKSVLLFVNQKYKICISYMSITFSQYGKEMGIFLKGNTRTLHRGMPFWVENFHWKVPGGWHN